MREAFREVLKENGQAGLHGIMEKSFGKLLYHEKVRYG